MSANFPAVILASASPRRRELLTLIGVQHTVQPADIDETPFAGEVPDVYAERLARAKASAIADGLSGASDAVSDAIVVAADTIVVIDDQILGKPVDRDDAVSMLRRLSGRTHTVVTSVACSYRGGVVSAIERVLVTFSELSDTDIERYVDTGEPMDKAGSYGIQGYGAIIVRRIDGDYFSVMGLPVNRLIGLWKELGVEYRFGR